MKKNAIIIIGCVFLSGLLIGCPGKKGEVVKDEDIVVTNTVIVKDISQSKVIQAEAIKISLDNIAAVDRPDYRIKQDTTLVVDGIPAYRNHLNLHYLVYDLSGVLEDGIDVKTSLYMIIKEEDGKYTHVESIRTIWKISDLNSREGFFKNREILINRARNLGRDR